jgi:Protein of unknown function (DUF1549)/Protein of unknown function (DUF1553)
MRRCCLPLIACTLFAIAPSLSFGGELLSADQPIATVIDHYIDARLHEEDVHAAPQADDANLIRRLTLDLVGRIPTLSETSAFIDSKEPDKRTKLVERLMSSPAFVRHQANQFEAMMSFQGRRGGTSAELRDYLIRAIGENRSWQTIFRELITPDDKDPKQKGASEFLRARAADTDRMTVDVSVLFFGVNVSCAQCHDHPLVNDWKQDHFYGMKSFFARTFDNGGFLAEREFGQVKFKPNKGAEKQAKMMFLTGKVVDDPGMREPTKDEAAKEKEQFDQAKKAKTQPPAPKHSARAQLVAAALEPAESDYFARAIVNRLWHRLMGFGLVTPLDQMHSANEPTHPELLEWLARDIREHDYGLRRLIQGIVMSKTYSRSSVWPEPTASHPSPRLFAMATLRPLTPMQLATSMKVAVTDPKVFETLEPAEFEKRVEALEQSARGVAGSFAQPTDEDFQIGVSEALLFSNGEKVLKDVLTEGNDRLLNRMKQASSPDAAIDMLFRVALSRAPREEELKSVKDYLQRRADRPAEAYQQVLWALLSGAEFRFNY